MADQRDNGSERITVLLPCRDQREDFLRDAVDSVLRQTSPHWALLVGLDESPDWMTAWFDEIDDPRLRVIHRSGPGFARTLNRLLAEARTPFVSILLSDDRYALDAIETLLRYRERHPEADFFHSSRRYIDVNGSFGREPFPSKESFDLDHFKTSGSPVKHLLCWRRELALEIGGMDESLSLHGCDDFDFPWRMAEAGARFKAVSECLYEYRVHDVGPRLTTGTPIQTQVDILQRMFAKHGVTHAETCAFLERAADTYLPVAFSGRASVEKDPALRLRRHRVAPSSNREGFTRLGLEPFVPHEVVVVPVAAPGAFPRAERLCGVSDPAALRQLRLTGVSEADTSSSDASARSGEASLVVSAGDLFVTELTADAPFLVLNAVLHVAIDSGIKTVHIPTDRLDLAGGETFEARRSGDWWQLSTGENADRIAPLQRRLDLARRERTICLTHDIERGLGHRDVEPRFAAEADRRAPEHLARMLAAERDAGVRGTYCVVGSILEDVRAGVEADGHTLAFHSFDHRLPDDAPDADLEELVRCRQLDDEIAGYRPPQSRLGPGYADEHLARHGYRWLASSRSSLGRDWPDIENGIVKIPIHMDDFGLHRGDLTCEEWERKVLAAAAGREFFTLGLHDCYADHWIDRYPALLEKLDALGTFRTFDEVADDVVSGASRWTAVA